jgi:hypothetical protein
LLTSEQEGCGRHGRVNQEKRLAIVWRTEEFNTFKTMWIGKEQETYKEPINYTKLKVK